MSSMADCLPMDLTGMDADLKNSLGSTTRVRIDLTMHLLPGRAMARLSLTLPQLILLLGRICLHLNVFLPVCLLLLEVSFLLLPTLLQDFEIPHHVFLSVMKCRHSRCHASRQVLLHLQVHLLRLIFVVTSLLLLLLILLPLHLLLLPLPPVSDLLRLLEGHWLKRTRLPIGTTRLTTTLTTCLIREGTDRERPSWALTELT